MLSKLRLSGGGIFSGAEGEGGGGGGGGDCGGGGGRGGGEGAAGVVAGEFGLGRRGKIG